MEFLIEYGLIGLFLASFLAATVVPLGSEAIFGVMIASDYNLYSVIVVASVGNWLGGMSSFYLGYIGKWEWIEKYFKVDKSKVEAKRVWLQKYGSPIALFCWLPFIGDILAIGLGFIRSNVISVSLYMVIGKTVRYVLIAYLVLYLK